MALRKSQIETLMAIRRMLPRVATVRSLAEATGSPLSSTSARVRKLVASGHITRHADGLDVSMSGLLELMAAGSESNPRE